MRIRIMLLALLFLLAPCDAEAAGYLVRPGDTLGTIAVRYHVSVNSLARANGIRNPNVVAAGRLLVIPTRGTYAARPSRYRVQWGDSLSVIAVRFHTTVASLRALNPSVGRYLLAGQTIAISSGGGSSWTATTSSGSRYVVRQGDNLTGIASRYGVSLTSLMTANRLTNANLVVIGAVLTIPSSSGGTVSSSGYNPWAARVLIERYAAYYGLPASLPLAVADEESGFNESAISRTGAIGVMQVEPYTADHINDLLGLRLNMYNMDDNIHAGVYWLSVLVNYYGGNQRLAVAAYYEGTKALARKGMYRDTVQYVNNVTALEARFGG